MTGCSFLPAATRIIQELGLEDRLAGVTFECPADRPRVVRSVLEGRELTSAEIDREVAASIREGRSLYRVDRELLQALRPDVVFTQHVCDVCQVGTSEVERALGGLDPQPEIVALVPHRLEEIYGDIEAVAAALGEPERGVRRVAGLRARTRALEARLAAAGAPRRRAVVLEWMDPLYNSGHWIPDLVAAAGGHDPLGTPGGHSTQLAWEAVIAADPEVLVVAPCGFPVERARAEAGHLASRPGWGALRAVRDGAVFLADGNLFTCPSGDVVDGIELLAALFHPALFALPERLQGQVVALGPGR